MKSGKYILFIVLAMAAVGFSSCNKQSDKPAEIKIVSSTAGGAAPAAAAARSARLDVSAPEKRTVSLAGDGAGAWTLESGGKTLSLDVAGDDYTLKDGSEIIADGRLAGEKLKMKSADGKVFLELKTRADKIKVSLDGESEPWAIKFKGEKIKVYEIDAESNKETAAGGVKYKADTGKLKAKDAAENGVAVSRDVKKLSAFPAAYLMAGMDEGRMDALALILFAMDR